ncbi:hypothetical protein [Thalassoglobus polymorphus]|nr:hypothetical protein [Thalassoglobus polymorphus]
MAWLPWAFLLVGSEWKQRFGFEILDSRTMAASGLRTLEVRVMGR